MKLMVLNGITTLDAPTVTPPIGAVNGDWYLDYSTYNLIV